MSDIFAESANNSGMTDNQREAIAREHALIDAVISAYHTTRLSNVLVFDHILSKPNVRAAFDALIPSPQGDSDAMREEKD